MQKNLVLTCLLNFFIAAVLGLLLRYAFVGHLEFNYQFLIHTHSHIAMLGWVYLMLYVLFTYYFIKTNKRFYTKLFWVTQLAVVGMLFSFPFQGYAAVSITFSTLHILCSYMFVARIWKDLDIKNTLIKTTVWCALSFMVLSTIGVWCLGPAVGLMGKASAFYQIAIQFFLHFQFNGWFLFGVLAVCFHQLQIEPSKDSKRFIQILIAATFFTLALPIQWFAPHWSLSVISAIGGLLQLLALFYFIKLIKNPFKTHLYKNQNIVRVLYLFALSCFTLKMALQLVAVFPEFSQHLLQHKNFIIGFIHLMMLGVVSGFLFAFLLFSKTIKISKTITFGTYSFLLAFLITEALLALQGLLFFLGKGLLPKYYLLLFVGSIGLPLGIAIITLSFLNQKHNEHQTLKTT